jgi:hypothetical protein
VAARVEAQKARLERGVVADCDEDGARRIESAARDEVLAVRAGVSPPARLRAWRHGHEPRALDVLAHAAHPAALEFVEAAGVECAERSAVLREDREAARARAAFCGGLAAFIFRFPEKRQGPFPRGAMRKNYY